MNNPVSSIFKALAYIVFIGGFVAGIVLGKDTYGDFSLRLALVYWAAFFVVGMLYYGFAEIIQLLTDIRDKHSDKHSASYPSDTHTKSFSETTNANNSTQEYAEIAIKKSEHRWRCDSCGKMISSSPCPYCGK